MELKKTHYIIAGGAVLTFAAGGASGYFYAVHKLRKDVDAALETEIEKMREHYERKYKVGKYESPESAVEALMRKDAQSIAEGMGYLPKGPSEEQIIIDETKELSTEQVEEIDAKIEKEGMTEVVKNVFVDGPPDKFESQVPFEGWDYENELRRRKGKEIYIISQDEFFNNEPQHEQATLTYFAGDGVLVDEADTPIDDITHIIGSERILKFGHGATDPNTVYIRNDALEHDVEVVQSKGKFAEEVYGFIQHSDDGHRKPPKRNWDDE
jgi:hypothetical protein